MKPKHTSHAGPRLPQSILHEFYTQFVDENKWENENYTMVLSVGGLTIKNKKTGEQVKLITQ